MAVKRTFYATIAAHERGLAQVVNDFVNHEVRVAVQKLRRACSSNKCHVLSISGRVSVGRTQGERFPMICFRDEEDLVASSIVDAQDWQLIARTKILDDMDGDIKSTPSLDYRGVFKTKTPATECMHHA